MGKTLTSACSTPSRSADSAPDLFSDNNSAFTDKELTLYAAALLNSSQAKPGGHLVIECETETHLEMAREMAALARAESVAVEILKPVDQLSDVEIEALPLEIDRYIDNDAEIISLLSAPPEFLGYEQSSTPHPDAYYKDLATRAKAYRAAWSEKWSAIDSNDKASQNMAPCPSPTWARRIFPNESASKAYRRLSVILAKAVRADKSLAEQAEIREQVLTRRANLATMGLSDVAITGPGTNLSMGLPEENNAFHTLVLSSEHSAVAADERVIVTPEADTINGDFTLTRPLYLNGGGGITLIDSVSGEIKNGAVTKLVSNSVDKSTRKREQAILDHYSSIDGSPVRVTTVSLVDQSGPLAESGVAFNNHVLDANSGLSLQTNSSLNLVIGSHAVEVKGQADDGTHSIMKNGLFAKDVENPTLVAALDTAEKKDNCHYL